MPLTPSFGDRLTGRVTGLYAAAENKLIRYIAGKVAADTGKSTAGWRRIALRIKPVRDAVGRILDQLRADSRVRVSEAMREAMENGRQAALDDLTPTIEVPVFPVDGASAQRAEALSRKLEQPLERAKVVSENAYQRIIREVTAGQEAKSGAARRRLVQQALDRFAAEGITGFVDKRGRSYDLVSYAEMAVRTAITEAEVSAYLEQARHAGLDLVIISDVPQSCVLCLPFEGKILSITGATRGAIATNPETGRSQRVQVYASIEEAKARGLWHPGCRHTVKIWTPSDPAPPDDSPPDHEGQKAREKLRRLERRVRRWKRVLEVAQSPESEASAKRRIRAAQADIRRHIAATGISRDRDREQLHRGHGTIKMAAGAEDQNSGVAASSARPSPGGMPRKAARPSPAAMPHSTDSRAVGAAARGAGESDSAVDSAGTRQKSAWDALPEDEFSPLPDGTPVPIRRSEIERPTLDEIEQMLTYNPQGGHGGHGHGMNIDGKTEYPQGWDKHKLRQVIDTIIFGPETKPRPVDGKSDRWILYAIVDSVLIVMPLVHNQSTLRPGWIINTAHPWNGEGVFNNSGGRRIAKPLQREMFDNL